jgi:hypothetical protein
MNCGALARVSVDISPDAKDREVKIVDYGDGIIFVLAAMLGIIIAFDATAVWFWRLLVFCFVTFTLGVVHPALRFAWSLAARGSK